MRRLQLPDLVADAAADWGSDDEDEAGVTGDARSAPEDEDDVSGDELRQGDDICVLPQGHHLDRPHH